MKSIFFDLETTDLNPCGQILNFSFIFVDEDFKIISECKGDIKITRLELPSVEAMLVTQTDILEHQKKSKYTELQAMNLIHDYIQRCIDSVGENVCLIGYNSYKFDIPFLRTSMIRNGVNPYFKNIIYKDLFFIVQNLACKNKNFRQMLESELKEGDKFTLRLEYILKVLKLNENLVAHNSSDDVKLTINLAKYINDVYKLDVRTYNTYEVGDCEKKYKIVDELYPNYDLKDKRKYSNKHMVYLDSNDRSALWIDLEKYKELLEKNPENLRDSIRWVNKREGRFLTAKKNVPGDALSELAKEAVDRLSEYNLSNYFQDLSCDVEQHIYMLNFNEMNAIGNAIKNKNLNALKSLKSPNANAIYLRHLIRTHVVNSSPSDKIIKNEFIKYCIYRYGGMMKIGRFSNDKYVKGVYNKDFHPTYNELLYDIQEAKRINLNSEVNMKLLISLEKFYMNSEITKVIGKELRKIYRHKEE